MRCVWLGGVAPRYEMDLCRSISRPPAATTALSGGHDSRSVGV